MSLHTDESSPPPNAIHTRESRPFFPGDRPLRRIVFLSIITYSVAFSVYTLLRYYSFRTLYFDLGIYSYSMNQVLHGLQGIQTLILPSTPGHPGHFSPILVIPFVLFAIVPSPATLLVFQSLLLALAAVPLFQLSLEVLHRTDLAVILCVAYLLFPGVQGVNRYDFHVESFVPLLAFVALLAVVQGRFRLFLLASLLLLCTHEVMSIVFVWTGGVVLGYQILQRKPVVFGRLTRHWSATTLGLGVLFLGLAEALNVLLTPSHSSLIAWLSATTTTYSGGLSSAVAGIGVDPARKILYWGLLLVPLFLLPLLECRLLLPTIPWLGLTILASNAGIYNIYTQYSAFVVPFLFFAVVWALRRPDRFFRFGLTTRQVGTGLLVAGLIATAVVGPLSPLNSYDGLLSDHSVPPYPPMVTLHDRATAEILGLIPRNASVLAQSELFSQVSDRRFVAPTWNASSQGPPEFIAVDMERPWFRDVTAAMPVPVSSIVPSLLANYSYAVVGFSGTAFVYRLEGPSAPSLAVEAARLPSSLAGFAGNWTASNGTASWSPGGMDLAPQAGQIASLAESLPQSTPDVLVDTNLEWSGASGDVSWSGVLLRSGAETYVVFLIPSYGQLWYARMDGSLLLGGPIATLVVRGTALNLTLLASGGTLQVWANGRLAATLAGVNDAALTGIGVVTLNQNLRVASLVVYRSTAGELAAGSVPWDAIAAGLLILAPASVLLWFWPELELRARRLAGWLWAQRR